MARPTAKFFEAQTPPDLPIYSQDNLDWYKEQKERCLKGFSFRGDRMTGDQWWFYNMCPMPIVKLDRDGNTTDDFGMGFPYWSQEDDYLFKQIEEAEQEKQGVMLMTGRGFGKTQIVISIGGKIYYLKEADDRPIHCITSASGDAHASATFAKFGLMIKAVNKAHPSLALNLLKENDDFITAGDDVFENGKWETKIRSMMERIVYGNLPGKTKGRRVDFQHWEEVGDWTGSATLKQCISASRGTLWVGKTKIGREFYTGTGGTVVSDQAKEVASNPGAYGLYKVYNWSDRGTSIVIPAFKKYGGYWEKTGISDEVGAKAELEKIRTEMEQDSDPTALELFKQEYPFDFDEMFAKRGGNRFDKKILARNIVLLEEDPSRRQGMWVNLHWKKKDGEIIGVEIEEHPDGKIWILEKPYIDPERNEVPPRLYVGGYDGIDVGQDDTASGLGSQGAISIKKRLMKGAGTNNIYVCHYWDRPRDIDDLFDNCHKIMVLYHAITNIEDSKRGIVGHLKKLKALKYLMKRPRLTLSNPEKEENDTTLIGTTPTDKNFQYGEKFLATYIKEYGQGILNLQVNKYLRDFSMAERGKYDVPVSMMMCEIGDDEFMDRSVGFQKPVTELEKEYGYYTDAKGVKRWGEIPKKLGDQFGFDKGTEKMLDYIKNGKGIYLNDT